MVNIIHSCRESSLLFLRVEECGCTRVNSRGNDQREREIILLPMKDTFLLIPQRALVGLQEGNCGITERGLSFDIIRSWYIYLFVAKVAASIRRCTDF